MLLTIRTTSRPGTDLGYLLHKHPDRLQTFELSFGRAHVFYPEATAEACTAALLLDVDPVGLVRGGQSEGRQDAYVNDRPYVASSFLSVALARVFRSAMAGQCKALPGRAQSPIPLEARLAVLPCRGGEAFLRRLFEPLGYAVHAEAAPLEGASNYYTVTLHAHCRLSELLTHLYVLVPVLDDEKHYWVGDDEVAKLLRMGEGWLDRHPERETIARRYLRHQRSLVRDAIRRLIQADETVGDEPEEPDRREDGLEETLTLNDQRLSAVLAVLRSAGASRVLDLGCGEGKLLRLLRDDRAFAEIVGVDVSHRALERAARRLKLERQPTAVRDRIRLLHGSLTYRDARLADFDAAAVVEVIEHLDVARLGAFERVVFEFARPRLVVVTTPNAEYNVRWATLPAGQFRHPDHRFEWTRAEFATWTSRVAARFGYHARHVSIGDDDPQVGSPTQMAVFTREGAA